ncbi:MAG: HAD-IA family hydrolase [Streptosporangiales bacterium]|nr:HAD-IA family hydrolase [Streptosporangiales bacterium]
MIFDCDGVLVDTERIAVRVDAEVLAELGWPLGDEEIIQRFLGRTQRHMYDEISAHLGNRLPDGWEADFERRYLAALDVELKPVEGVVDVLDVLDVLDLPMCVASSGSHEKMRHTLGHTGLYERFEGRIFSATEVAHGKPEPDLFLHAAARMGVEPSGCVVVEDSHYGVQAARAAGMRSFGYAGGITPADWLAGPDTVVFDDMRELPRLLAVTAD